MWKKEEERRQGLHPFLSTSLCVDSLGKLVYRTALVVICTILVCFLFKVLLRYGQTCHKSATEHFEWVSLWKSVALQTISLRTCRLAYAHRALLVYLSHSTSEWLSLCNPLIRSHTFLRVSLGGLWVIFTPWQAKLLVPFSCSLGRKCQVARNVTVHDAYFEKPLDSISKC